jgi:carbonic anhydrase
MGASTYEPVPIHIANNGHTIQVNDTAGSSLVIDGATYALAQFHFHVPAEHVVAGKHFDAEMHLVHKTHDGHVAVVALFVKSGQPNAALAAVIDHAPATTTTEDVVVPGAAVDLQAMLPKSPTYLRYDGSLTVPPCTEGVTWLVVPPATGLVEMSPDQIAKLGAAMHAPTNRPLQPLNGRAVSTVRP